MVNVRSFIRGTRVLRTGFDFSSWRSRSWAKIYYDYTINRSRGSCGAIEGAYHCFASRCGKEKRESCTLHSPTPTQLRFIMQGQYIEAKLMGMVGSGYTIHHLVYVPRSLHKLGLHTKVWHWWEGQTSMQEPFRDDATWVPEVIAPFPG